MTIGWIFTSAATPATQDKIGLWIDDISVFTVLGERQNTDLSVLASSASELWKCIKHAARQHAKLFLWWLTMTVQQVIVTNIVPRGYDLISRLKIVTNFQPQSRYWIVRVRRC